MDVIQILPINDSGYDPSPYNALSAFALNPILLRLEGFQPPEHFNNLERIDYLAIAKLKEKFIDELFVKEFPALKENIQSFIVEHPWVKAYAKFKVLKKKNHGFYWREWNVLDASEEEQNRYIFEQYLCFKQMRQVKEHATRNNVFIMGDIPILISPDSAEVWSNPEIFNCELCAGAPPDFYSAEGQKWGFPLYRWDVLEKTSFEWWKERLKTASEFFHLYRVDHIFGFYRLWAMGQDKPPKEGFYFPQHPHEWVPQGEKILKMLVESTTMLPIGEDLGIATDEIRASLKQIGIPGTKVFRWERMWSEDNRFIPYSEWPELSLTTVSTHDSEPLRLWWETYPEDAKLFAQFKKWDYAPNLSDAHIKELLWDSHHTPSRFHVNLFQEYLSMNLELRYENFYEDRINFPGIISSSNWSFRLKKSLEEIFDNTAFHNDLADILH